MNTTMHAIGLLFAFSAVVPCGAATLRVPTDVATIQGAIDEADDGDTVLVAQGVYHELLDFHGKTLSLVSERGPLRTTIDGQGAGTIITMQSGEGPDTLVEGFTITGGSTSFGAGMYLLGTAPRVRNNIFANNAQGSGGFGAAIGGFSGSPIVEGNEFFGNSCDGQFLSGVLSFVNSSSPRIFNNIIHDNPCRAIDMTIPVDAAPVVYNNTIVRNATGIYIDHRISNSNQTYRNNILAENGIGLEVAFEFDPFDAVWTNNLVFANAVQFSGTEDSTGTNGNLADDPRFEDSTYDDFVLGTGSAAIDAGTATGLALPATDFNGSARVQDGNGDGIATVDIGAFEAPAPDRIFGDGFEAGNVSPPE